MFKKGKPRKFDCFDSDCLVKTKKQQELLPTRDDTRSESSESKDSASDFSTFLDEFIEEGKRREKIAKFKAKTSYSDVERATKPLRSLRKELDSENEDDDNKSNSDCSSFGSSNGNSSDVALCELITLVDIRPSCDFLDTIYEFQRYGPLKSVLYKDGRISVEYEDWRDAYDAQKQFSGSKIRLMDEPGGQSSVHEMYKRLRRIEELLKFQKVQKDKALGRFKQLCRDLLKLFAENESEP